MAQKVKYKDLFALLSTRQFDTAEPVLKRYLAETTDNPNAYLYMAIILQEKGMKDDILRNTQEAVWHMDSAVINYTKAYNMIDEKELKRNKDYYAMYNRRDVRTGEYGVKLPDIQYTIEKANEELRERIDKVKMIKHYFVQTVQLYQKSNELFLAVQEPFNNENELYLRSDETLIKSLQQLSLRFDSCQKAFDHYKIAVGNLPKSGYNQSWNLTTIRDLKTDGREVADFYEADLKIWNYKAFADNAIAVINSEILPIREQLVKTDMGINKLEEKLSQDSVSVSQELGKLMEQSVVQKLKKYDPDPFPGHLLAVKALKLDYRSMLTEHIKADDNHDLNRQLDRIKLELSKLQRLDSAAKKLADINIDAVAPNYKDFITSTYSTTTMLKNFIRAEREFASRELRMKSSRMLQLENALNWLVVDGDSIPISTSLISAFFKPLVITEQKYTAGLSYKDPDNATGYFYTITPTRIPDIKVRFVIDHELFSQQIETLKGYATADQGNSIYFFMIVNETAVSSKYPVTVAKIYRSDGLSWTNHYALDFLPTSFVYVQETGDLAIKAGTDNMILVDKGGSLKQ